MFSTSSIIWNPLQINLLHFRKMSTQKTMFTFTLRIQEPYVLNSFYQNICFILKLFWKFPLNIWGNLKFSFRNRRIDRYQFYRGRVFIKRKYSGICFKWIKETVQEEWWWLIKKEPSWNSTRYFTPAHRNFANKMNWRYNFKCSSTH